ncbi:MAG: GNAT family N-acetyltransferase [Gemmatimonadaceae bacterium]|nr:GNAT family N-acetyltransferase [Gloeobacterales cyanobacterium ES-bin-141]
MLKIRPSTPRDIETIFGLIQELAAYEKLSHAVTGSPEELAVHLFGPKPYAQTVLAERANQAVGYALFFFNYSTFLTRPGLYLEDLYVRAEYRGEGIGKALLVHLAGLAVECGCGRMEWSVLDWNKPAIGFYERMGAVILDDWRSCRVSGEELMRLANG